MKGMKKAVMMNSRPREIGKLGDESLLKTISHQQNNIQVRNLYK